MKDTSINSSLPGFHKYVCLCSNQCLYKPHNYISNAYIKIWNVSPFFSYNIPNTVFIL